MKLPKLPSFELPENISLKTTIGIVTLGLVLFCNLVHFPGLLQVLIAVIGGGFVLAEGIADFGEQGRQLQSIREKLNRTNIKTVLIGFAAIIVGRFAPFDSWTLISIAVLTVLSMLGSGLANMGSQGSEEI